MKRPVIPATQAMNSYEEKSSMTRANIDRRHFLGGLLVAGSTAVAAIAQERSREQLREPVFRVANNPENAAASHPLDPAIDIAGRALGICQNNITDYTCTLVKRERIKGTLGDHEYMFTKIRNGKSEDGRVTTKFSVYLYFLKPEGVKGREVLYIEGDNEGKLIAKEGGLKGRVLPSVWLTRFASRATSFQMRM